MSVADQLTRQWMPMAGGSCDVRMGHAALKQASPVFRSCVGRPRACLAIVRTQLDETVRETLRRQLVDAGFAVTWLSLESSAANTIETARSMTEALANAGITSDDLCCVLGDANLISVASHVCGSWCGGMSLVAVPEDELALLEGAIVPRALDVGMRRGVVAVRPFAQHVLLDFDLVLSNESTETSRYLRSLMVATAMAGSEREFSELWDRADKIAQGDEEALQTQLLAVARARGQLKSSTAAAVRQSADYGRSFENAVSSLSRGAIPRSVLLAEGMRFSARIAVALEKFSIDDMLAQDELLETLGIGFASCSFGARELCEALKQEEFERKNRFMLLVPFSIGQVRYVTVDDDMLEEHARAWCAARGANA